MVLGVQVLEGVEEAVGDLVLGIELDGALNGDIANDVAVGEVLGKNARAGLLLLRDFVGVTVVVLGVRGVVIRVATGAGDGELIGAELGVVKEESSLLGRLLLEGDFGRLGLALGGDLEIGDLATAREVSMRSGEGENG